VAGAAGMGGEDATEEPSGALRAACETLADAWCGRAEECNPPVLIEYYGDPADCRMVESAACLSHFAFDGMSKDPAGVLATADQFRGDCARAMIFGPPANATTEPGFFELGAECTHSLQCKSRACYGDGAGSCGVCSEPPEEQPVGPEGAPCEPPGNYGTEGFFCHPESLTWLLVRKAGDPCQLPRCDDGVCSLDGAPCESGASCDGERCVQIGFLGDSCDPLDGFCQYPLVCAAGSRVCEDQTADSGAAVGEDCSRGPLFPNLELCRAGAFCTLPAGARIETYDGPGVCAKVAGMGESCDQSSPCGYAFECRSGTCELPVTPACVPTN
jgi:hypothetical protein